MPTGIQCQQNDATKIANEEKLHPKLVINLDGINDNFSKKNERIWFIPGSRSSSTKMNGLTVESLKVQ